MHSQIIRQKSLPPGEQPLAEMHGARDLYSLELGELADCIGLNRMINANDGDGSRWAISL